MTVLIQFILFRKKCYFKIIIYYTVKLKASCAVTTLSL